MGPPKLWTIYCCQTGTRSGLVVHFRVVSEPSGTPWLAHMHTDMSLWRGQQGLRLPKHSAVSTTPHPHCISGPRDGESPVPSAWTALLRLVSLCKCGVLVPFMADS